MPDGSVEVPARYKQRRVCGPACKNRYRSAAGLDRYDRERLVDRKEVFAKSRVVDAKRKTRAAAFARWAEKRKDSGGK